MRLLKIPSPPLVTFLALSLVTARGLSEEVRQPVVTAPAAAAAVKDELKQPGAELVEVIFEQARAGETKAVQMYLEAGYTPSVINPRGDSLLIIAAYHGHAELVKLLLAQPKVPVDQQNKMGFTPLTGASFKGETAIMGQLLAAGAKVNHQNASGQTALMFAALTGRLDAVKLLLKSGADATLKDKSGKDAASLATQQGADEVTAALAAPAQPR